MQPVATETFIETFTGLHVTQSPPPQPTQWVSNSGAPSYVTYDPTLLQHVQLSSGNNQDLVGDGTCLPIIHTGHNGRFFYPPPNLHYLFKKF